MSRFSRQHSYLSLNPLGMVFVSVGIFFIMEVAQSSSATPALSSFSAITIAPTPSISVALSRTPVSTSSQSHNRNISFPLIIELLSISWRREFLEKTSPGYIALENNITRAVERSIRANISAMVIVEVKEFKPGSVLAFLNIKTNTTEKVVEEILMNEISDGELNGLQVSKTLFSGVPLFDVVLKIKTLCNDSKELKGFKQGLNLTKVVQQILSDKVATASVQKVLCPIPYNITVVTVRVQVGNANSFDPNQELKDLKRAVEIEQLGSFELLSEWQAYIPGEKQFFASFDLRKPPQSKAQTTEILQATIQALLERSSSYLRYVMVVLRNDVKVIVEIGMKSNASDLPKEALKPIRERVLVGKVGTINVKAFSYEAYINPNTFTQRVFGVHFRVNMFNCSLADIKQNQLARTSVQDYIAGYIKQFEMHNLLIGYKLHSLKCVNGHLLTKQLFAQAEFWVYLKRATPDDHRLFLWALYKCKKELGIRDWGVKIVSLTPTSSPVKLYTHYICGWKPLQETTPASTEPTKVPTRTSSGIEQNPNLYVKAKLGITWKEFCSKLEHSLKQRIAWILLDKNGTGISPDRIVFLNVAQNCADPSKTNERAEVWFYVAKSDSKDVDDWVTLQAYRMLQTLLENGGAKRLGPEFERKVIHVDLVGGSSAKHVTLFDSGKLSTLAIILIAIAGAVGLVLLIVACCCAFCNGAYRRKRRKGEDSQALHVIQVDANGDKEAETEKKQRAAAQESMEYTNIANGINTDEKIDGNDKKSDDGGKERVVSYENQAYSQSLGKNDDNQNPKEPPAGGVTPTIVTSPAPDYEDMNSTCNANSGGQSVDTASSGSGCSRRGSRQENGSKPPSPASLKRIDADLRDRGRRRSSAYSVIDDEDVPLTHKTGTVGIVALALRNRNEKKKEAEFKNLSKDVPEEEIKYPENTMNKNRSSDVLPAPKTRVKLSSDPDYINANWIRDHKGQRRYIATQHPLHETAKDFWRMVWEQDSRLVVMVNEDEKEKPTDFMNYLPRGEGNTKSYGGIEITVKHISQKSDYTLTTLRMSDTKKASSATREISHMRFTSWKGRAMPNVALFVGFVTATREERKKFGDFKAPTIVHCSDGLGFTGVYIALDIGIMSHEESKTSVVDVFELSKNLRRERHGIISSLSYYNFIYQALYEYTVNYDESAEALKR
ncbi:uncharacterized protein [Acropora muricata]|uniref:uncharacterized protein isoform X2 n=1 Tax=Acropora muricata TaxID=159855 RepID=UPI0034E4E9F1